MRLREGDNADVLVSLLEPFEYEMLKVPDLKERARALGFRVLWLPISDGGVPEGVEENHKFKYLVLKTIRTLSQGNP